MTEKPSLKHILDIYYALRAQGVQRYPKPMLPTPRGTARSPGCVFLVDFGTPAESAGGKADVHPLLKRLLEKLPWRDDVLLHTVFHAQPRSPQLHPLDEDLIRQSREVLTRDGVGRCVCFGWRAAQVAGVALGIPFALPAEAYEALSFEAEGLGSYECLVLPDVRELEAFPEWRAKVWESLLSFGAAR